MPDFDPLGCNAVLIQDYTVTEESKSQAIYFLSIITEETYKELRKGGGADADFPIKGIPVKFGANYEEFSVERRAYLSLQQSSLNYSESLLYTQRKVSPLAFEQWGKCKALAAGIYGLNAFATQQTAERAVVRFVWNPPVGVDSDKVASSSVGGGKALSHGVPEGEVFAVGTELKRGSYNVTFERTRGEELVLSVGLEKGYPCDLTVQAFDDTSTLKMKWYTVIDSGDLEAVKALVAGGADVSVFIDSEENQPLHRAAEVDKWKIAKYLLEHGADKLARNVHKDTPRSIAANRHPGSAIAALLA